MQDWNANPIEPFRDGPESASATATRADTDGRLDWPKVTRLAWRPAWSIRSRRGSVAPFVAMLRDLFGRGG